MKITLILLFLFPSFLLASSEEFFKKEFKDKDGCFLLVNVDDLSVVDQYNKKRCERRFPPMSTFKIPFIVMAFESGYFKSADQKIAWDGVKRRRKSVNRDQTPKSFISNSVIWVSRKIIHHLGKERVQNYVNVFDFGNKKLSGDFDIFWLSQGSIKVSAQEQVKFLARLWTNKVDIKKETVKLTREATFDRIINGQKIYGKTGTGCIDEGCINTPGRQLGWYVGIREHKGKSYAFALNFSDLKKRTGYGGWDAKQIVHRYFSLR